VTRKALLTKGFCEVCLIVSLLSAGSGCSGAWLGPGNPSGRPLLTSSRDTPPAPLRDAMGHHVTASTEAILATSGLTGGLRWIILGSVLAIVISLIAMVNGSRAASSGLVGGITALGLALAIVRYAGLLAIIAVAMAVGFAIWSLFIKEGFLTLKAQTMEARRPDRGDGLEPRRQALIEE